MAQKGFWRRLWALIAGLFGLGLDKAEISRADAVYRSAVEERRRQRERVRDAVARLTFLYRRTEGALERNRGDLTLIEPAIAEAARRGDDETGMALLAKRRSLGREVERLEGELAHLERQTKAARQTLTELGRALQKLRDERSQLLARKAHAQARLQISDVLGGDEGGGEVALDNIREAVVRLECRAELASEGAEPEPSLARLRRQTEQEADRAELEALKRQVAQGTAPMAG